MLKEYILKNKEDTKNLAELVASKIKKGDILMLNGDLGVGKTFFVSCFVNYFCKKQNKQEVAVTSPTFNIVKTYQTNDFLIYHFDLYRIKNVEELYELDLEDAFDNVSLIEWPEIINDLLPHEPISLNFELIENDWRKVVIDK